MGGGRGFLAPREAISEPQVDIEPKGRPEGPEIVFQRRNPWVKSWGAWEPAQLQSREQGEEGQGNGVRDGERVALKDSQ